jgi:uncharacterized membrane protein
MSTSDFTTLLIAMALASYGCRVAGFLAMRFVPITPRLEAALRATPLGVMAGLVTVAALRGGPAEWLAAGSVILAMQFSGRDVLSALVGVVVIVLARWIGL